MLKLKFLPVSDIKTRTEQTRLHNIIKIRIPHELLGKNQPPINSAKSSRKSEVTLIHVTTL